MKQGTFSISRKEVNPLWKAPPTYFLRRGLPLPPEGSRERGIRGALGEHAIFIDEGRAIHSGPVWSDDVGGIKISRDDMALLFDSVPVGATVEVR
jgi:lipoprotein-anchoring transpeptidase ErfK/SrfK